jgi:spermidine synthase
LTARTFRPEIFLVSLAAILLEIGYTRVFSYKLHYYFVFLTIGIALLGLGAGGVLVAVSERLRAARDDRLLAMCTTAAALWVPTGYLAIATIQVNAVDASEQFVELAKLAGVALLLFLPFLAIGIVLARIFSARPEDLPRLYFSDLMGAGLGCALCVPLFGSVGPPSAILLGGAVLALAGLRLAASWRPAWLGAPLAALLVAGALMPGWLPDPVVDRTKSNSPQWLGPWKIVFSDWSTVFRVDVINGSKVEERMMVSHDGNLGSNVMAFDGDLSKLELFDASVRSTPFSVLRDEPEVLIIGAAGGHEILASLYFDAGHITAVELNPVTVSLLEEHFADYTGHIADHEKVTLINAEGRSFVERDLGGYDLIWLVAPDSYAAMNAASSGAFVLSESYLYTVEMIEEAMRHLKKGGVLCLQTGDLAFATKPNRAARYLSTARLALSRMGIDDFEQHVMVSSTPEFFTLVTILLSAEPFSAEQAAAFRSNAEEVQPIGKASTVWHPRQPGTAPSQPVQAMISLPDAELAEWRKSYPYDVSPVTDDSPFFWHFTGFFDAAFQPTDDNDPVYDPEDAKGERVLVMLLALVSVLAAVFLLAPLWKIREVWVVLPHKTHALFYFAALGLGFMFFEIPLIQKLTLFLGYPTYSLTVTIFALLVFSGFGSLLSTRFAAWRDRALVLLLAALAGLTIFYQFGLAPLAESMVSAPLGARVVVAALILAPLGLCLGAFLPLGLATVASLTEHREPYIAWCWAVNGFFSVMSSVLATMVSMTFGFRVVLLQALLSYAIGVLALTRIPAPRQSI